jgi:hypothetical protein
VYKVIAYRQRPTGSKEYLLKWRGYTDQDNSWEPYENLNKALQRFVERSLYLLVDVADIGNKPCGSTFLDSVLVGLTDIKA